MGGSGSGPYGNGGLIGKDTVDNSLFLDVKELKGDLIVGKSLSFAWRYRRGRFGKWEYREFKIDVKEDNLVFSYFDQGEKYNDSVGLSWTNCNYGGKRPWFVCPGCFTRKKKLFLKNAYFRCRECHGLTYISCQISGDKLKETTRKMYKLIEKVEVIDFKVYELKHFLIKPKGMHQETFERLQDELEWLSIQRMQAWLALVKF